MHPEHEGSFLHISNQWESAWFLGLGIIWILVILITIPIMLIDYDSHRFQYIIKDR